MKTLLWSLGGVVVLALIWHVWGYFSSRVEQVRYSVLEKRTGYEIRKYPAHIVAETTVEGSYNEALNEGFRIVAGYIFGGNTKKESIAMTAPVVETPQNEKVAMTAPVTANIDGNSHTIAFGMPASYTLETLPTPNDPRVKIVPVPETKMAALTFSWYATPSRILRLKESLIASLKADNLEIAGEPSYAGYNAPFTPPWLMRNEILVPVR